MLSIYTEKTKEIQLLMDLRLPCQRFEQHERSCKLKHIVVFTHNAVWHVANLPCMRAVFRFATRKKIVFYKFVRQLKLTYVPVKSKLQHPLPRAHPGHLRRFRAREGGNLMNLLFPRAGHLISTHRGWRI